MNQKYEELNDTGKHSMFRIPFGKFAFGVVSLPFVAFIFCVTWSVLYDFKRSTSTHCDVPNYLPSISAAIGNYQPQRFVWQMAILFQAFPRLLVAHQYVRHYTRIIRNSYRKLAYVACALNLIENIALIGLSLRTSSDDYGMVSCCFLWSRSTDNRISVFPFISETHKFCFIVFIAASETYMLISYILNRNFRKRLETLTTDEWKSLQFKKILFFINISSFASAGYFFGRHNEYCEPGGKSSTEYHTKLFQLQKMLSHISLSYLYFFFVFTVYTLFAFMEYIVVLTNMGYHMTAYWDFSDKIVTFDCINGFHMTSSSPYHYNRLNY